VGRRIVAGELARSHGRPSITAHAGPAMTPCSGFRRRHESMIPAKRVTAESRARRIWEAIRDAHAMGSSSTCGVIMLNVGSAHAVEFFPSR
jgi:hypothetical protein